MLGQLLISVGYGPLLPNELDLSPLCVQILIWHTRKRSAYGKSGGSQVFVHLYLMISLT